MRKLGVIAGLVLVLVVGHTANAAKPVAVTAVVTIDNPTPAYGDTVILTAVVSEEGHSTGLHTTCTHAFGQSFSDILWQSATTYSDDVGLAAPNWPSGAAVCTTNVLEQYRQGNSYNIKTKVIGSLTFEVAA